MSVVVSANVLRETTMQFVDDVMDYVLREGFDDWIVIYYFDDKLDAIKTVINKCDFNLFAKQHNLPEYGDFDAMLLVYMDDFVLQVALINGVGNFDGMSAENRIVYYELDFAECKDVYLNFGVKVVDEQTLSIYTCLWDEFMDASISENILAVVDGIGAGLYSGVFLSKIRDRDPLADLRQFGQVFVNLGV